MTSIDKIVKEKYQDYGYNNLTDLIKEGAGELLKELDEEYDLQLPDDKELYKKGLATLFIAYNEFWIFPSEDWTIGLKDYISVLKKHGLSFVDEEETYDKALIYMLDEPELNQFIDTLSECGINIDIKNNQRFSKKAIDYYDYEGQYKEMIEVIYNDTISLLTDSESIQKIVFGLYIYGLMSGWSCSKDEFEEHKKEVIKVVIDKISDYINDDSFKLVEEDIIETELKHIINSFEKNVIELKIRKKDSANSE